MTLNESKDNQQKPDFVDTQNVASTSKVLKEEVISLLEERLMVDFTRRKVGEIIVRKEIETHVLQVQVPVRREKLIVEQISPEYKKLAEVDLGQTDTSPGDIETHHRDGFCQSTYPTVCGELKSPKAASDLLNQISNTPSHGCKIIRIEIVLENLSHQKTYEELFKGYS